MCQLDFFALFIVNHRKDDIRIVQNSKGFTGSTKDFSSTSQQLLFTLGQDVFLLLQKLIKIMLIGL